MRTRARVSAILRAPQEGDGLSRAFDVFILSLITLNVVALILESVTSIRQSYATWFHYIEVASVGIFTVEYLLRLWSAVERPEFKRAITGRLRWARTPFAVIDLLAILPFYLPLLGVDLRIVRIVRLLRVFRVAKLARYSNALRAIGIVLRDKREELMIVVTACVLLLLLSSTLVYFAENEQQPEAFSSIPASMWWGVCTLTTVGYGDMFPVTPFGKVLASFIALLGIGLFALPAGILGAGFVESVSRKESAGCCPHCGKEIHAIDD